MIILIDTMFFHNIKNINHIFNVNWTEQSTCNPNGEFSNIISIQDYNHIYNDSYEKRFDNNMLFNKILKQKCIENNIIYTDINDYIIESDYKVKNEYLYDYDDHHLNGNINLYYYLIQRISQYI